MSASTGIGWTDSTWNPWYGCTKVSPGCAHCYMFREQRMYGRDPEVVTRSKTKFGDPLKWKEPRRVFTCSWSDWFHETADPWRDEAWDIIRRTPHLTYQILTKRPERVNLDRSLLPSDWGDGWPNVWLGTSIENQRWTTRLEELIAIPSRVRFVSAEPLLGPVDFGEISTPVELHDELHWVIVGGESGPNARPMELDWARSIRDQCREADVAFYLKQLGGASNPRAHDLALLDGRLHVEFPVSPESEAAR